MVDHNEEFVALFIDWDNLAISVAADLAGATPDVKRIVQAAQNFGTVLIARAYAEWNASSDRLAVYRAGVEPIYAPTFRFEPDPITQAARGKSLADPCMVADCVDILHILPKITTFVIVSGDKDLIPVVRLAQLRGKHAVVIGPDYAAGVLRDIADEFISYRAVIEAEPRPEGPSEAGRNGRRHIPTRMPQPPQPVQAPRRSRPAAAQPQSAARAKSREISQPEQPETLAVTVPEAIETPKTNGAAEPKEATYDISSIFATMVDIVRQRTGEGKLRIRATNLKDALIVKVPGFSERKYGFAKFKDFLLAAEKAGAISVSAAGPVHWVSLPAPTKEGEEAETSPAVSAAETAAEVVPAGPAELSRTTDEHYAELVKYVIDLRGRSRWLTYTYVLTNLISYLTKLLSQADAEAAARTVLNRLVQEGVLRIDREPQEVEVGGIKHRVRMCHIVENHPLVAETLSAYVRDKSAEPEAVGLMAESADLSESAELTHLQPMEQAEIAALQSNEESDITQVIDFAAASSETEASEAPVSEERPEAAPEAMASEPTEIRSVEEREPSGEAPGDMARAAEAAAANVTDEAEAELAEAEAAASDRKVIAAGDGHLPAAEVAALEEALERPQAQGERPHETSPALVGLSVPLSLDDAFAAVQKIVRESTNAGKPRIRLTGLKAKITGELGHFDEQVYGFKRFKDFLLAAEKAGWVKLENVGQVVWVVPSSPPEQSEKMEPAAKTERKAAPSAGENATPNAEPAGKPKRARRRAQAKAREVLVEG